MKKHIYLILLLTAVIFSACDMQKEPIGQITDEDAIESASDCRAFRSMFYGNIRALTRGAYVAYTEIQMDNFQALSPLYGNREGDIFNGNIYSNNSDITSIWAGLYGAIANCNFFIPRAEALLERDDIKDADKIEIRRYIAECHFTRAYYYYYLMDHYCNTPQGSNLTGAATGLPLVSEYNPTPNRDKYPGRSTLQETVNFIMSDLQTAYEGLKAYEAATDYAIQPGAYYYNSMVCLALINRMELLMGDNAKALATAEEIINSGYYSMVTRPQQYGRLWTTDTGNEIIFMPFINGDEYTQCASTGTYWISQNYQSADYVPSAATLANYDKKSDLRFGTFFSQQQLPLGGAFTDVYCFTKYPGNESIIGVQYARINMSKPFRLAEQYLIAAEAAAALSNETLANQYLNELRKTRIAGYKDQEYTGQVLVNEIRNERNKEFIGEGYRMSDLRRWKVGFTRDASTPSDYFAPTFTADYFVAIACDLRYAADDYRFVWPIPSSEIEVNPQLQGQQNPGYN